MARRLLSTAVQIKAAPTQKQRDLAILSGQTLTTQMPTDREVRDAIAKLVSELEDMRNARTAGGAEWVVIDGSFEPTVQITPEGEVLLRGGIIIMRPD